MEISALRQYPLWASVCFTFDDLTDKPSLAVNLPYGAIVTQGFVVVTTIWNVHGYHLVVGDRINPRRYSAGLDLATPGLKQFPPTGFKYGSDFEAITVALDKVGESKPTQGAAQLFLEYILAQGRSHENQPGRPR